MCSICYWTCFYLTPKNMYLNDKIIMKTKEEFEAKLIVGTKIRIGFEYSEDHGFSEGEIIILVEGEFENDNGLYTNMEYAPSVWDEYREEFESIYHLFGNDFENWLDCTIID